LKMTMMDAAIKYAEANIPVMPLHWICEDGSCSCKAGSDCDSKGKHPLYTGWYKNSTADMEQIRKWWTKNTQCQYRHSLQVRNPTGWYLMWMMAVMKPYLHLKQTYGKLPDTVTAVTGSGGWHYVFKYPKGRSIPNKTKFASGLDTRSTGGLIVVAPSIHVSGNPVPMVRRTFSL